MGGIRRLLSRVGRSVEAPLTARMGSLDNAFSYAPIQFEVVSNVLMFGVGAHLAGLVYFLLSRERVSPRYRTATVLSAVVMLTSGMMLLRLAVNWQSAFAFDAASGLFEPAETRFSNGFRYVNWLITLPLLIGQVLVVLDLRGRDLTRRATLLVAAATAMTLTGYVGQFYETTDTRALLAWGAVSTVFFAVLLVAMWREIARALPAMPPEAARVVRAIRWLLVASWMFYPGGYLVPVVSASADAIVARQTIFVLADVLSKVVYGVLLSRAAQIRSAAEGFEPAFVVRETLPGAERRGA